MSLTGNLSCTNHCPGIDLRYIYTYTIIANRHGDCEFISYFRKGRNREFCGAWLATQENVNYLEKMIEKTRSAIHYYMDVYVIELNNRNLENRIFRKCSKALRPSVRINDIRQLVFGDLR